MEDSLVGSLINRYKILSCVHKSELICFYKAHDTKLERDVFLKTILHSAEYSQESIDYFLSESKALAKLSHPNIAKVLDFGYDGDNLYLVSEYIPGKPLTELLDGPMNYKNAIDILLPLTEALAYAHSKGVLHRDLKPENIVINQDDEPILSDFSLLRILEDEETKDMTGTNIGLGSPAYISPEQGRGLPADFRSDIYSLGVIFFEMVTGQKPFQSNSSMEMVIQHVTSAPPRSSSLVAEIPQSVDDVILLAMTKNVDKRYQTMEQFTDALKSIVENEHQPSKIKISPVLKKRILPIAIITLVLGFLLFWWQNQETSHIDIVTNGETQPTSDSSEIKEPIQALPEISQTETINPNVVDSVIIPTESTTLAYNLPGIPVLSNKTIPLSNQTITIQTTPEITELARWGVPKINQVAFIDNDQLILAATSAGLYYFDAMTLEPRYLVDTKSWLSTLAVSKDKKWVATGDISGKITVWSISSGEQIAELIGHSGEIISMDFSSDNTTLVSTALDNTIRVWDVYESSQLLEPKKVSFRINKVVFFNNGNFFVSGGDDFQIMLWDAETGELVNRISTSQKINDLAISSDNKYVAVALNSAAIEIWDISEGERLNYIEDWQITAPYTSISFLPNNQLVVLGSADGITRIWNSFSGQKIWETPRQKQDGTLLSTSAIKMVDLSDDGTKIIVLSGDRLVEIWSIAPTQQLQIVKDFPFYTISRLSVSPNGEILAYQAANSHVNIISAINHKLLSQIKGTLPRGEPFSLDNSKILINNNSLDYYEIKQNATDLLYSFFEPPFDSFVNFLDDNKIVVTARAGVIKYWSTASGKELTPYSLKPNGNCRVIYRLDGNFLAAGSVNGVLTEEAHVDHFCKITRGPRVTSSKFLNDGSITAFSLENQILEIWDKDSNQKQAIRSESKGHMLDVAISKDGSLLAAASASGMIELYNLETLELITTLYGHTAQINTLLFSGDQKYLVSGSNDGTIRFWGLHP